METFLCISRKKQERLSDCLRSCSTWRVARGRPRAVRWDGDGAEPGPPRRPGARQLRTLLARPGHRAGATDAAAAPRGTHGCVQRVMLDPGNGPGLCIYCAFKSLFRVHFLLLILKKKRAVGPRGAGPASRVPRVSCLRPFLWGSISPHEVWAGLAVPARGPPRGAGCAAGSGDARTAARPPLGAVLVRHPRR